LTLDLERILIVGASRGIGLEIAHSALARGASTVVVARKSEALTKADAELAAEFGRPRVQAIIADAEIPADRMRIMKACENGLGFPTSVVLNVGSGVGDNSDCVGADEWSRVFSANLWASIGMAELLIPAMVERRAGNLLFISSIAGIEAIGAPVAYSTAKAALNHYVKVMARRVGAYGVRINALAPGNVLFEGGTWESKLKEDEARWRAHVEHEVPLGRFGSTSEVAASAMYLLSSEASFVTGAIFRVDGGQCRS
jgi:3-oxoacyl-[acyl-carrier protein] reductase